MSFTPQHILVPLALDPEDEIEVAERSVDAACDMAEKFGSSLSLLYLATVATPMPNAALDVTGKVYQTVALLLQARVSRGRLHLADLQKRVEARGIKVKSEVIDSAERVAHAICDFAKDDKADLIVISTHGRHGIKHFFLGSVAEKVVHLATVPVLLLRGQ